MKDKVILLILIIIMLLNFSDVITDISLGVPNWHIVSRHQPIGNEINIAMVLGLGKRRPHTLIYPGSFLQVGQEGVVFFQFLHGDFLISCSKKKPGLQADPEVKRILSGASGITRIDINCFDRIRDHCGHALHSLLQGLELLRLCLKDNLSIIIPTTT